MNRVQSIKSLRAFIIMAVVFCVLIGGCTKVVVHVSIGSGSTAEPPSGPPCNLPEKALAIVGYQQENSSVCWAASAQMVINHFRVAAGQNPITQCSIVDAVLNKSSGNSCCGVMDQDGSCMRDGLPEAAFNKKGFTYAPAEKDPLRENLWAKVTNQICEEKPLILAEYFVGGGGHSSVIYGFGGNGLVGERWVDTYDHISPPITDPLTGLLDVEQVNYDEEIYFVPGNDTFYRTNVYYTFDIQPQ